MNNKIDLGVRLCYLLFSNKITPQALSNIKHELSHASQLFSYLYSQGKDIDKILLELSKGPHGKHD